MFRRCLQSSVPKLALRSAPRGVSKLALDSVAPQAFAPTRPFNSSSVLSIDKNRPLTELDRDFLDPEQFFSTLKSRDLRFFTGVPDSLLADFCAYVTANTTSQEHLIATNEGHAITLAAGYHLASGKTPVVYMQNSGFGNCVNPLLSLCDPKVYSIPMLLLIGWRGEPGKKDEPQHIVQGKVMTSMLASMDINFQVLPDYAEGAAQAIDTACHYLDNHKAPYALLVKRQTFLPYSLPSPTLDMSLQTREESLEMIMDSTGSYDAFVTTTGFTSREVFEYRNNRGENNKQEFLCVGSMGYASSIAQGVAMAKPSKHVYCIDGDGAFLMHMGPCASIGNSNLTNYKHILINNGCHDSVGGQPTIGNSTDFPAIARASGYKYVASVSSKEDIQAELKKIRETDGPVFLEIKIRQGTRKNLGRPKASPATNKQQFMQFLQQ